MKRKLKENFDTHSTETSTLVKFHGKNYYVKYADLLNKANDKLFAYEDYELTKNATLNGKTLMFNKKDMEDKLKGDIKMPSRMPGAAKTENISNNNKKEFTIKIINKFGRTSTLQKIFADPNTTELFDIVDKIKKASSVQDVKILEPEENKMTNEQKLRKYIREMVMEALKESDPYGKPDEDKYLFKTGQDYLAGIQGDSGIDEEAEQPSEEDLAAKQKAAEESKRKQAYQRFFSQALAKFGYSSPASIPDEKKKSFYDYIDANWTSKQEEPVQEVIENNFSPGDSVTVIEPEDKNSTAWKTYNLFKNRIGKVLSVDDHAEGFVTVQWQDGKKALLNKSRLQSSIQETSATGGVAGYETPAAFTGKKGISKKQKSIANQLGYELVDKSYAVKDQGDVQDLKEAQFYGGTDEAYLEKEIIKILSLNAVADSKHDNEIDFGQKTDKVLHEDDFDVVANQIIELLKKNPDVKLNEGLDSYYFKDENLTTEQKLGLAMRQVRNNLYEVEKVVTRTIKMKNEENVDSSKVGKRTYSALKRINEKVIRLMIALQDLK